MSLVEVGWIPKDVSRKQTPHYDSRLVRQVEPVQPELAHALRSLKNSTSDFVDYTPLGKLGVTLCELSPAARQIFYANKKGDIDTESVEDFTKEIGEVLDIRKGFERSVAIANPDQPLSLYGNNQDRIGIRLSDFDPLLLGERAAAEKYILSTHPEVSSRFASEDLMAWEPHVTIGRVKYEQLGSEQRRALFRDPADFLIQSAAERSEQEMEKYELTGALDPIVFPDELSLGGLKIVCEKQDPRMF